MGDDFVAGIVDSTRTVLLPTAWGGSGGGGGGGGGGTGGDDMQRVDKRKPNASRSGPPISRSTYLGCDHGE
jgi:hypothetical protein